MIDRFSFAPVFLRRAGDIEDPYERFKLSIAFNIAGMYLGCNQDKPFNPLLGETFQGYFPDGTKVYVEHSSHHPPIDNFCIYAPNYRVDGAYELYGTFSGVFRPSLVGGFRGRSYVRF
jgi:hypothetical protein